MSLNHIVPGFYKKQCEHVSKSSKNDNKSSDNDNKSSDNDKILLTIRTNIHVYIIQIMG